MSYALLVSIVFIVVVALCAAAIYSAGMFGGDDES